MKEQLSKKRKKLQRQRIPHAEAPQRPTKRFAVKNQQSVAKSVATLLLTESAPTFGEISLIFE
jgi:hypothetical protein